MHPDYPVSPEIFVPCTVPIAVVGPVSSTAKAPAQAACLVPQLAFHETPASRAGLQPGSGMLLGSSEITLSAQAMRSPLSFETTAFAELKKDISCTGGNVEPVIVRLLVPPQAPGKARYELLAGHRRVEACRQLKLDVLCLVVGASDTAAAQVMAKTNVLHSKPSPYELGCAYVQLLADKVYATQKELADHLGPGESEVTNAQILARLDPQIIAAFDSPLTLRYRDARPLRDAWQLEPDQVVQRTSAVLEHPAGSFSHAQTVDILLGVKPAKPEADSNSFKILVQVEQTLLATIRATSRRTVIELAGSNWSAERLAALVPGLQALLGKTALNPDQALDIDLGQLGAM